jgi:hypothetical protein
MLAVGHMCRAAKRARLAEALPDCIVEQLIASIPHNTYLYLCRSNRESVCCALVVFEQCKAVHTHAAMLCTHMQSCCGRLRAVRSPVCEGDEAGLSPFALTNSILELHLHMQQGND